MTSLAETAGEALLRAVEELAVEHGVAADTPALERIRRLSLALQPGSADFEALERERDARRAAPRSWWLASSAMPARTSSNG